MATVISGNLYSHTSAKGITRTVRVIRVSPNVDRIGNPMGTVCAVVTVVAGPKAKNDPFDTNLNDLVAI
jgi:hypothetical protein